MLGASSMLCKSTFTFTTFSIEEPAASSSCLRLPRITRVSLAVVPRTGLPDCRSTAVRPDTKMKSPPRTAKEAGVGDASDGLLASEMMSRVAAMQHLIRSGGGDRVELDLEASLDLRRPHCARGRAVGHVLPINTVEHVVFDAVVDQRMHLDQPVER